MNGILEAGYPSPKRNQYNLIRLVINMDETLEIEVLKSRTALMIK